MGWPTPTTIRPLLPAFGLAVFLPIAIRTVLPEEEVGDFAMAGLGLGCAILTAKAHAGGHPTESGDPDGLRSRQEGRVSSTTNSEHNPIAGMPGGAPLPVVTAMSLFAVAVFLLLHPTPPDHTGLPFPLLALLTLAPALGIVPYLTVRTGKPFAAVVLATFIVALVKLAACVVVRIVYGPNALADGYMSGDWQSARLMISLFWIGTLTLSIALGNAARRPGRFCLVREATA